MDPTRKALRVNAADTDAHVAALQLCLDKLPGGDAGQTEAAEQSAALGQWP
ncbi:hypothetical protein ACSMXN_20520 [Jatrophihabitans sp. DSM 45814]